jgi:hypothetical protein
MINRERVISLIPLEIDRQRGGNQFLVEWFADSVRYIPIIA